MTDLKLDNSLTDNTPKALRVTCGSKSEGRRKDRKTKKQELIRLLGGKTGADVARLSEKLGWRPQSVRAALTGLRKDGYDTRKNPGPGGKPSRYRILPGPGPSQVGGAEARK